MDKYDTLQSTDDNIESPTTYGKDAYKKYRKKEKLKGEAGTLGGSYRQRRTKIVMDVHYASVIAQLLKNLKFPSHKPEIIEYILKSRSRSVPRAEATDVLSLIQLVQEKEYQT